ncbi:hypothetical protein E0F76_08790 [Flavobacterium cellulosilyticum]|uniref:Uncharacterized protein n=2 Tax=Flavobacterium cellulosilyticum TaxID=2541731 RepID=A0A4R5CD44_9FLAO|nr:hypothetical protein E0F76_08790 [Flavobacterium cellulosilyticum]
MAILNGYIKNTLKNYNWNGNKNHLILSFRSNTNKREQLKEIPAKTKRSVSAKPMTNKTNQDSYETN